MTSSLWIRACRLSALCFPSLPPLQAQPLKLAGGLLKGSLGPGTNMPWSGHPGCSSPLADWCSVPGFCFVASARIFAGRTHWQLGPGLVPVSPSCHSGLPTADADVCPLSQSDDWQPLISLHENFPDSTHLPVPGNPVYSLTGPLHTWPCSQSDLPQLMRLLELTLRHPWPWYSAGSEFHWGSALPATSADSVLALCLAHPWGLGRSTSRFWNLPWERFQS